MRTAFGILTLVLLALAAPPAFCDTASLSITNTAALEFGGLVAYDGGTVTVSPTGVRSRTGTVMLVTRASYPPSAASFAVTGDAAEHYSITLPATAVLLTSGSDTMSIDTFTKAALTGTLGILSNTTPGTQDLRVGGTLHVGVSQPAGRYVGSFPVTINFE